MRFSKWLLTASAVGLTTVAAAAQQGPATRDEPAPETKAEASERLPDVESEAAPAEPEAAAQSEPAPTPAPPPPPAAGSAQPLGPLTRAQMTALDRTMERGRLLVAIARAGIVATQDMLTRISDPNGAGITGWIAEPAGNAMLVTFYSAGGEPPSSAPKAVYRATVLGGRVTSREIFLGENRPALTPIQARMAAARAASDSSELRACSDQPFNVLVVPPASASATVDVYRTSSPAQRGRVPLGGHFRSTVAADGTVATHAFANGCAMIDAAAQAEGQQPAPVGVTHLLDPLPTEIHMLVSQTAGRPLLVVAGDPQRVWLVTGDRIAEVRSRARR